LKIFILARDDYKSPRILAKSLQLQLQECGIESEIFFKIEALNRLANYKESKLRFHFWLQRKIAYWYSDRILMQRLKEADAVIISECIPNAFWRNLYHVEKLKSIIRKPVFIYEVYWLSNAPTQIHSLKKNGDEVEKRYDGHLYVSPTTEIRTQPSDNAFCIGLMSKTWDLEPLPKKELLALVDFVQPGYESHRKIQISQLTKAGIPYIALEKKYTIEDIRDIYRQISLFFVQFPEAFGLPILECLCTGAQVFTPDSSWPMSWRLDEYPQVHSPGILPECFTLYNGEDDLLDKLLKFKEKFNQVETPQKIFKEFIKYYPTFYEGNQVELKRCLEFIKMKKK
jgi:hypothetical protein